MRFKVTNRFETPMTVFLEPTGAQLLLGPGDYITIEWPGTPSGTVYRPEIPSRESSFMNAAR